MALKPADGPLPPGGVRRAPRIDRGDLVGGMTAAVVMLALYGSYGIVALTPLGPAHASTGFMLGIFAGVVGNLAAVAGGARGPLLGGPAAAMALLVPPLLVAFIADSRLLLADGRPDVPLMLALVAAGVLLGGMAQALVGVLRLGVIARYVPYPVHAGFMNGVAVLMVLAMLPHALGLAGLPPVAWHEARPFAAVVALLTLLVALRPPAWTRAVPAPLTALLTGTVAHHALVATVGPQALGPLLGALPLSWPRLDTLAPLADAQGLAVLQDHAGRLLQFAAVVAATASMQTVMAGSVVDAMTGQRHDGERRLRAEGVANMACGLFGLLPGAAAVSPTLLSLHAGGSGTASRLVFGAGLLIVLAFGVVLMRHVPMAAIAGVLMMVAFSLVDDWSRRATGALARQALHGRRPRGSLQAAYAVMAAVALTSVLVSLTVGVGVGVLLAMLMFIRSNVRPPVRAVSSADRRGSRKVRPAASAALLKAHGERIAVVDLDGPLFFGTAAAAAGEIERIARGADQVVVDFRRVGEVDASGARVLLQAAASLRRAGKRLLLASLPADDGRRRAIEQMDVARDLRDAHFHPDADRALEEAEDWLLERLAPAAHAQWPLELAHTSLGAGLDAGELDTLAALLVERRVARGEVVFRRGEAGDMLYTSLSGQIGIWLPDPAAPPTADGGPPPGASRLVSFAPGVVFGEMALLRGLPRSADAVAEADTVLLALSRVQFERLVDHHPRLHGKLMRNISLHLADRLRALTDDLQAADAQR